MILYCEPSHHIPGSGRASGAFPREDSSSRGKTEHTLFLLSRLAPGMAWVATGSKPCALLAVCGEGRQRASGAILASRTGCVLPWVNWLFALFGKHTSIKTFFFWYRFRKNSNTHAAPIGRATTHQASHSDRDTAQTHRLVHGGGWSACESEGIYGAVS